MNEEKGEGTGAVVGWPCYVGNVIEMRMCQ